MYGASGTPLVVGRTGADVVASRHARVSACGVPQDRGAIRPAGRTLQTHLGAGSTPHGPEQNCLCSGRRRSIGGAVRPRCGYWDASRRPPAWTQFPRHGRVGPVHRWARPSLLLHDTDRLDVFLRKPQDVSVGRFDLVSLPGFSNVVFRLDLISGLSQIRGGYFGNGHATALFGFECDKGELGSGSGTERPDRPPSASPIPVGGRHSSSFSCIVRGAVGSRIDLSGLQSPGMSSPAGAPPARRSPSDRPAQRTGGPPRA